MNYDHFTRPFFPLLYMRSYMEGSGNQTTLSGNQTTLSVNTRAVRLCDQYTKGVGMSAKYWSGNCQTLCYTYEIYVATMAGASKGIYFPELRWGSNFY